jgi:DNA-binding MarR family transcriptional regulator
METLIKKRPMPSRGSELRNAAVKEPKNSCNAESPTGFTLHPRRLLLGVAQQSGIGDPESCRIILSIFDASRAVRRALCRDLDYEFGFHDNSGVGFLTLVTLYALSPLPATATDLAYHAEVDRTSMADIINALEQRRLVTRYADGRGRITRIELTDRGQQAAVLAVHRFLKVASTLAGNIGSPDAKSTVEVCEQVESRAAVPAS